MMFLLKKSPTFKNVYRKKLVKRSTRINLVANLTAKIANLMAGIANFVATHESQSQTL
jgi:hypothetical protein